MVIVSPIPSVLANLYCATMHGIFFNPTTLKSDDRGIENHINRVYFQPMLCFLIDSLTLLRIMLTTLSTLSCVYLN